MLLKFLLRNFLVGMLKYFKKKKKNFFPQKVEKTTPKHCILLAVGSFFSLCSPDCSKQPRTSFPFYNFFYPIISGRISAYLAQHCEFDVSSAQQKQVTLNSYCLIVPFGTCQVYKIEGKRSTKSSPLHLLMYIPSKCLI